MKKYANKAIISLLALILLCSSLVMPSSAAAAKTPKWSLQKTVTCYYSGDYYRVKLYKDSNFEAKQVLFTSSPVYHTGNEVSYSLGFSKSQSDSLSTTLGVSVKEEVKAFGNGVSASLGLSSTISTSYSTSYMATHEIMNLDSSDKKGYWAVYGYNNYEHYKIAVEKRTTQYTEIYHYETQTYTTGWLIKKTQTKQVKVVDGYSTSYIYTSCPNYSGDFLICKNPAQTRLDYLWLGAK